MILCYYTYNISLHNFIILKSKKHRNFSTFGNQEIHTRLHFRPTKLTLFPHPWTWVFLFIVLVFCMWATDNRHTRCSSCKRVKSSYVFSFPGKHMDWYGHIMTRCEWFLNWLSCQFFCSYLPVCHCVSSSNTSRVYTYCC